MPVGEVTKSHEDSFWPAIDADIAAIHKLLDCEPESRNEICPVCNMPFDKGKKRKLIDTCGHEKCYSCMFRNESCPLCAADQVKVSKKSVPYPDLLQEPPNAHYTDLKASKSSENTPVAQIRSKVKTNGHFTPVMQSRNDKDKDECYNWQDVSPKRLPRPSRQQADMQEIFGGNVNSVMTQSCPTATPPTRRRFFNVKNKGSAWSFKNPISRVTNSAVSDEERNEKEGLFGRLGLGTSSCSIEGTGKRSQKTRSSVNLECAPSVASLATEANNFPSSNTSPMSTLTGSSEAEVRKKEPSSDSVGSLLSVSSRSNCSPSPSFRRHSVTTSQPGQIEELNIFKNRKCNVRRSARSALIKGPLDPKVRFAQYRLQQTSPSRHLNLKPLFFEVPSMEGDEQPLFVGRDWLARELDEITNCSDGDDDGEHGVLISGLPGTGKTALILQMVEHSCFGRRREQYLQQPPVYGDRFSSSGYGSLGGSQSSIYKASLVSDYLKDVAARVVAYHFCQADNNSTCMVPDFVHSVAAQMCQAPLLAAYKNYLLGDVYLQESLSMKECIIDADLAFVRGVLEPLANIDVRETAFLLVDALCEAEYHRPDHGDTIASFISKHAAHFPPWLKIICTIRTRLEDVLPPLPFHRISLDVSGPYGDKVEKDLLDYANFRVNNSPGIRSNLVAGGQFRFCQHLLGLARGSFLFSKLTLDLLEKGHLVAKSATFKVLPVTLGQIYSLHFNLRFPTTSAFQKVFQILNVVLAALYPLTLNEIFYCVNSLCVHTFLSWEEFSQRIKMLSGFLVKRMDGTYMIFHPSLREWLIKRDENESNKFCCDLRTGHSAIAFHFSRMSAPLDPEKTLELGHHVLKAHIYKNMTLRKFSSTDLQSFWIVSVSRNVSEALGSLRNIYSPNTKVSRLLLLSGASSNHRTDLLGQAPVLCLFASEGNADMVSLLLEFGADVDGANNQGCSPLILAATKGHMDVVQLLVSAGSTLGKTDTAGRCALVHAARNGHLNVLAYLLACDWVLLDGDNEIELAEAAQQALIAAASQNYVDIVEYLLDVSGVDADSRCTISGETALTIAATNGCQDVCSALLARDCRISATNRKNMSALMLAAKEGHYSTVERLLKHQPPLEQTDDDGKTSLMIAAAEGHGNIVELMLDEGLNVDKEDYAGFTALSWACFRGRLETAQCLTNRNADINHSNKEGKSALDLAASQGNPNLVQFLIDRGAVIEHADLKGIRPLDRAIGCRNIPVVQCFLRKGAKLGPTTWLLAAGKPDIMLVLLNKLLEDGNVLYRKGRLREAAHRYGYALSKFPPCQELDATFKQLRLNFLLNYSRCKRKMSEPDEAIELATEVLKLRPDSFEAYYARAKARMDLRMYEEALSDVQEALSVVPHHNRDVRLILIKLRDEIRSGTLTISSDTANHAETTL